MVENSGTQEAAPIRLRVLGTPRHQCGGCSACCSSYRVGPLTQEDLTHLEDALPLVHDAFPDQLDGEYTYTVRSGDQEARYLRKSNGFCVFFRQECGCTLHASAGGDQKPLACQLFPLQLVDTDDGIRLGNRPTCLSDWKVWENGPALAGEFIEQVIGQSRRAPPREMPPGEEITMRLLQLPDLDTRTVLSFLAQRPDRSDPPEIDQWLKERLSDLFAAADSVSAGEFSEESLGPLHPNTVTATEFANFRTWAQQRVGHSWPEVHEEGLGHLRDSLARLVFLRQTSLYPTLSWALLGYISAARWASAYACSATKDFDRQAFGRCFSTLLVILESPRMQRSLLETGPPFA
jgi:Fe-S-cluster containining protein